MQRNPCPMLGFLLLVVLASCEREKPYNVPNCATIWNGTFHNIHNGIVDTKIIRKGDIQVEHFKTGSVSKFKVEWLDSCRYRLTYVSGDRPSEDADLRAVVVQVTGVKEESYTFEAWIDGTTVGLYKGEMVRE